MHIFEMLFKCNFHDVHQGGVKNDDAPRHWFKLQKYAELNYKVSGNSIYFLELDLSRC